MEFTFDYFLLEVKWDKWKIHVYLYDMANENNFKKWVKIFKACVDAGLYTVQGVKRKGRKISVCEKANQWGEMVGWIKMAWLIDLAAGQDIWPLSH